MSGGLLMLLKELCTFLPKSKIKAGEGLNNGKYPFFTSSDTKRQYLNDYLFDTEAVILGTGGTASCNYCKGKFATSTDNFVLETNSILKPKYLYYFLRKNNLSILSNGFKGSGLKHISKDYVGKIDISLKTIDHQNQIIKILDDLNGLILNEEKNIEKYNTLIKSRFNEMFGKETTKKVGDICSSFKIGPFGSALHKYEIKDKGYAFVLGTDNAVKNDFAFDGIRYIDKEKYEVLEKYKAVSGDVIMSMMGTVGRVAVVPETLGTAIISSHLCILRTNPEIMSPDFFQTAFSRDDDIQNQISGIRNGSIMNGFNLKIVKSFDMKCPSLERQGDFLNFKHLIDKLKFIFFYTITKW